MVEEFFQSALLETTRREGNRHGHLLGLSPIPAVLQVSFHELTMMIVNREVVVTPHFTGKETGSERGRVQGHTSGDHQTEIQTLGLSDWEMEWAQTFHCRNVCLLMPLPVRSHSRQH